MTSVVTDTYVRERADGHEQHEAHRADKHGFLAVTRRGGHDIVRPRHPSAPRRAEYTGTPAYPADPAQNRLPVAVHAGEKTPV